MGAAMRCRWMFVFAPGGVDAGLRSGVTEMSKEGGSSESQTSLNVLSLNAPVLNPTKPYSDAVACVEFCGNYSCIIVFILSSRELLVHTMYSNLIRFKVIPQVTLGCTRGSPQSTQCKNHATSPDSHKKVWDPVKPDNGIDVIAVRAAP